ncbi:methyl-accepting chemotaxis protein [Burkholderia cepacia]|uniref:methyl-accepting chemotaxis protein n=1 Tax=Burkholderia cepacia TaxID=292 RepID=UPI003C7ECD5E
MRLAAQWAASAVQPVRIAGTRVVAAKEIKGLIEQSTQRVDEGAVLIGRAGESIHEIVDAVQRVTTIVGEISSASQEQSQTVAGYCASTQARIDGLMFDCAMLPP